MNIRESGSDRVLNVCVYIFLSICSLLVLYPLIYVVSCSFSDPTAVAAGEVILLPVRPTLRAYEMVLDYQKIWTGFRNSILYTGLGTVLHLACIVMVAFPLSRKEFYGRGFFTFLFAFPMYFSGGLIPTYLLMNNLHMLDTIWVMIIPGMMSVWHMIMCRTYFQTSIPNDLFEASQLDGCTEFSYMIRILVPLSTPILSVLALYHAVSVWNSYFGAMIYLTDQSKFPLQVFLREILVLTDIDLAKVEEAEAIQQYAGLTNLMKYAVIVVASVPVMCLYPFVQKYFVKGVMIGSIKG